MDLTSFRAIGIVFGPACRGIPRKLAYVPTYIYICRIYVEYTYIMYILHMHIHVHTYPERERERESEIEKYMCIYIDICIA